MERKAVIDDFDAIYEIYMDTENNPFLLFEIMDKEAFRPLVGDMVSCGDVYVYEVGGRVAATYRLIRRSHRLSHIVYLGGLALHPDFKSLGLGSRIMNEIIARLTKEGIKRLELLVVTDNHKAIQFYKSLGFEVEGIFKQFLKRQSSDDYVDELAMAKLLA